MAVVVKCVVYVHNWIGCNKIHLLCVSPFQPNAVCIPTSGSTQILPILCTIVVWIGACLHQDVLNNVGLLFLKGQTTNSIDEYKQKVQYFSHRESLSASIIFLMLHLTKHQQYHSTSGHFLIIFISKYAFIPKTHKTSKYYHSHLLNYNTHSIEIIFSATLWGQQKNEMNQHLRSSTKTG